MMYDVYVSAAYVCAGAMGRSWLDVPGNSTMHSSYWGAGVAVVNHTPCLNINTFNMCHLNRQSNETSQTESTVA